MPEPHSRIPPEKPILQQEVMGIPRHYWLPICAFFGGALLFLIVDLLCLLLSRTAEPHPGLTVAAQEAPR